MLAIVDYNAGNTRSVQNALHRLGCESVVTDSVDVLQTAERVIFPGVGEAASAMTFLRRKGLDKAIINLTQPVLGICLGLQLMCRHSQEGNTECLGIFDVDVKQFPPKSAVPHMGWNNFTEVKGELFSNISQGADMYYVHSFYAETCPETAAICEYIVPFSAALQRDNFLAVQFHPEKSADQGAKVLKNFLEL